MPEIRRPAVPPAWARDPFGRYPHRLFDGRSWTDRVARGGRTYRDAFLMGSPSPPPELSTECLECGFDVGSSKFCPRCGTAAAPPALDPYCYQCGSNPPPSSAFCQECGSRLDALAPGLTVRDAIDWQVVFNALGWLKDAPDPQRALKDREKKPSRRNLPALLNEWDLPTYAGDDPAEPWVIWLSPGDRSSWLGVHSVEVRDRSDDKVEHAETLIITRSRIIAIAGSGGLTGSKASLLLHESLANVTEAIATAGTLRFLFAGTDKELQIEWHASSKSPQLPPATARVVVNLNRDDPTAVSVPMRRSTDRRDGRFLAETLLATFARRVSAISAHP
jgi:hypothetical protein